MRRAAPLAALVAVLAHAPAARAQDNSTAFSVDRFTAPLGDDALLGTDEPQVLAHLELSVGLVGSLMSRPIVLERISGAGEEVSVPVESRLATELMAAIGLGDRYQLGLALPLVVAQSGDRLRGIGFDETELSTFAVGDLRLGAKVRIAGRRGEGLATAVTASLVVPTGDEQQFAGEAGEVFGIGLVGGWRARWWRVAANAGARFRTEQVVLFTPSRPHTNELLLSLAAAAVIPRVADERIEVTAELAKVFGDCRDKIDGDCVVRGYSPAEVRFGGRARIDAHWTVEAGVGFGTTPEEVGSPEWRAIAGVRWRWPLAPSEHASQ